MVGSNKVISELLKGSSLHGFDRLSNSSHRTTWIMVIVIATTLCISMFAIQLYFFENDTTSTIVDVGYPTSLVQFPHVEICNKYNVDRQNAKKLEDIVVKRGYAKSGDEFFMWLKNFMANAISDETQTKHLFKTLSLLGYGYRRLILEVGTRCTTMLLNCTWNEIEIDCKNMFQRVVTFDGICCRFQIDYFKNNSRDLNINYNPGYRTETGLNVALNLTTESEAANGAIIYLFYNDRTLYDTRYEVDVGSSILIGVNTQVISSSSYVRNMSPLRRKCGLIDKNSPSAVDVMTRYTYEECLTYYYHKAIWDKCNCLPFYVKDTDPRGNWGDADLCSAGNVDCMETVSNNSAKGIKSNNGCLHACDEVAYQYNINYRDRIGGTKTSLSVYYVDSHCNKLTKVVLLTWDQLFASLGGIFGLCLGGSIISIAEFLYALGSFLLSAAVVSIKGVFRQRKTKIIITERLKKHQKFKSFDKKIRY